MLRKAIHECRLALQRRRGHFPIFCCRGRRKKVRRSRQSDSPTAARPHVSRRPGRQLIQAVGCGPEGGDPALLRLPWLCPRVAYAPWWSSPFPFPSSVLGFGRLRPVIRPVTCLECISRRGWRRDPHRLRLPWRGALDETLLIRRVACGGISSSDAAVELVSLGSGWKGHFIS